MHNDPIQQTIDRFRRQLVSGVRRRILWQFAAAVGCCFWIMLTLDRTFEPPPIVRATIWLLLAILAMIWSFRMARPLLRARFSDQAIACLIARRRPQEGDLIATALDLKQSTHEPIDQDLADATLQRATVAATQLESLSLVRDSRDNITAGAALVTIFAALLFTVALPEAATVYARRMALSHDLWPRGVQLMPVGFTYDPTTGYWQRKVARGERTQLEVQVGAKPQWPLPSQVRAKLRWSNGDKAWRELVRIGNTQSETRTQSFRLRLESVTDDLTINLRGGDSRINLQLLTVERPVLTEMKVTVMPPDYLKKQPYQVTGLNLAEVREGSSLQIDQSGE